MEPISLYIHIPFCTSKCHYCSFNSITGKSRWIERYVAALTQELAFFQESLKSRFIQTIFLGGGTPSLLSGKQIASLLQTVRRLFSVSETVEISLESNPGTLNLEKLVQYRQAGINRISMGVQSFQPSELKWLGRTHSVEDVLNSAANIKQAGFTNFNLDLIFGLPEQTLSAWQANVAQALALKPTHISLYHLTIEAGSTFGDVKQLGQPSDEAGARLFEWTRSTLEQHQFEPYEISNYARPGFRCRHNETYWQNRDCIGVGAGAWTYFQGTRYLRPKTIEAYIKTVESGEFVRLEEETLSAPQSLRETLVFGLRTRDGVSLPQLQARYQLALDPETQTAIEKLVDQQLLIKENEVLRLTPKGFLFADSIAVELI